MAKKAGKTAKTVVDVILGEAGGRTRAERWREMVQIASVIQNRARKLRVSPEDVVGAASEFNAFGKELPAGVEAYRAMANQALQYVQRTGPINDATFYATPSNVPYLPEKLEPVTSTGYHNYYLDPQDRPIKTGLGVRDVRVVLAIQAPTPVGRPPSAEELDPTTTRALRQVLPETAPARPDRRRSADPSGRVRAAWGAARDDTAAAALRGLGAFAPSFASGSLDGVDPSRYSDGPIGLGAYSPEVQAALAQAATSPNPAAIRSLDAPSASPLGMGTAERNAALEAGLARQFTPDRIAANLAAARANNAAPSTGGTIPDGAARADAAISSRAWGPSPAEIEAARQTYAGRPTTAASVQRVSDYTTAKADRPRPGGISIAADAYGAIDPQKQQPIGPEATITGTSPSSAMSPNPLGRPQTQLAQPGIGAMPGMATYQAFTPQDESLARPSYGAPTIAPPDQTVAAPSLDTFPDAPPEPTRARQIAQTFRVGLQQLQQGLANGIDSGPPAMGGPNFGSGLAAMQQAMSGPTGGMAQSRSNPGYGFQKTATGGFRFGPKGWQALDAAGEQSGGLHPYDGSMGLGGYLGGLFEGLGGVFGGGRTSGGKGGKGGRKSGRDSVDRDHGRGLGAGLY